MEEIIKKLIAIDKAAGEKVDAAEKKRDSLAAEMSVKKQQILKKSKQELEKKLEQMRLEAEKELESSFSQQEAEKENERVFDEMDKLYESNKEKWVAEIFKRTVS